MNGPDEAAWSNTTGVHTLTVTQAVTHLPDAKPEAVTAQIHNGHDDVLQIRLEGPRLLAEYNDDGAKQIDLDPHYTLGTRYTLTITAANRRVQISYNGAAKVDLSLSGDAWYFTAGAYVQSNTGTGDHPRPTPRSSSTRSRRPIRINPRRRAPRPHRLPQPSTPVPSPATPSPATPSPATPPPASPVSGRSRR
jgi:hypothetical protein